MINYPFNNLSQIIQLSFIVKVTAEAFHKFLLV